MTDYQTILVEQRGAVALLTLNRPDKLNAWTPQMMAELAAAIEAANADRSVGAIVLTGAGRGFCAGADISVVFEAGADDPANRTSGRIDWIGLCRRSKPLIAAVNGPAVGIGVTMILPFDVIVASEAAKFGLPFVKMGIVPELASSHFLTLRLGFGRASELALSGRLFTGTEALGYGLAQFLAPPDGLMEEALRIAGGIAANPDPMLRMTKELLARNAMEPDWHVVQQREGEKLALCWDMAEHKEAIAAFREKRPAKFR